METDHSCPIAIVGVGCRFPGGASSPERLWEVLSNGQSAWSEFPPDRMNINGFYHPSPERSDGFNFKGAHFISGDVAAFDANFFGVAKTEADAIDPQQRILLEVAYEAAENAGIPMEALQGSRTCVFVGSFVKDYEQISMRDSQTTAPDCATGNGIAIMANRISYFFDLQGTSQTIDTGCSASLVCVHQAVNDLRSGKSDLGFAGGAGLILTPSTIMPMTSLGFLSADGKCFTFDSRANGYGRGEGVGIVVLKRLSDAIRDNDTIRAVIRGTASNQDGHTAGITVPNPDAQVRCINAAYQDAGLDKDETAYVECHGTGTKVGDWRELKAISSALCDARPGEKPMYVGSVKPNIGHLEGSAGVAGLIKAILIAEKGQIPPHINFENWNPDIKHDEWRVDIARELMAFPAEGLRRISVNCFGFGGTNAHGVMDDARGYLSQRGLTAHHNTVDPLDSNLSHSGGSGSATPTSASMGSSWDLASQSIHSPPSPVPHLFVYSTNHRAGLPLLATSHLPHLESHAPSLRDYSYTLLSRRSHLAFRAFTVASTTPELARSLPTLVPVRTTTPKPLRPALIFSGQGAQYPRMAVSLLALPAFAASIAAAHAYLATLDPSFDLVSHLHADDASSHIHSPAVAQPATTAVQVALVDVLRACGVRPAAVVGHSSGEIAAAYAAGYLSREEAWRVAFCRGRWAGRVTRRGRMLAVALGRDAARGYLGEGVVVACVNAPGMVTLSGDEAGVMAVKGRLDGEEVWNGLVGVETAYHSEHMGEVEGGYREDIEGVGRGERRVEGVRMFSSLTGGEVGGDACLDAEYWARNMTSPVEFEAAVRAAVEEGGVGAFIEVSPHRVWGRALGEIVKAVRGEGEGKGLPYYAMMEKGREGTRTVLEMVGELWTKGVQVEVDWMYESEHHDRLPKCLVDLPPYPWDHSKTYWHESHLSRAHRFREFGRLDYIGAPTADGLYPYEPKWRGFFRLSENPWLKDHKVQNELLYPAAGMVVMAIEGAKQVVHEVVDSPADILDYEVSQFEIKAPMVIPADDAGLEHTMNAKRVSDSFRHGVTTWVYEFAIYSKPYADAPFQENAKGLFTVRFHRRGAEHTTSASILNKPLPPKYATATGDGPSPFEFYEGLDVVGMSYGPLFRNIIDLGRPTKTTGADDEKECYATLAVPNTRAKMPMHFEFDHVLHPATLDAVFQTFFTLAGDDNSEPMVPFFVESVRVAGAITRRVGAEMVGVARGRSVGLREAEAGIDVWEKQAGKHVVQVKGLRAMSIASTAAGVGAGGFLPSHRNLCSTVVWKEDVAFVERIESAAGFLDLMGYKNPAARVLQVGGDERTAGLVLGLLADGPTPRLARYGVAVDAQKFDQVVEGVEARLRGLMVYEDVQGLTDLEGSYDVVIIDANETTVEASVTEKLLAPGGFMLLTSKDPPPSNRPTPTLTTIIPPTPTPDLNHLHLLRHPLPPPTTPRRPIIILTPDSSPSHPTTTALLTLLTHSGLSKPTIHPLPWLTSASAPAALRASLVISLLELHPPSSGGGLVFDMSPQVYSALQLLLHHARSLLWVTPGAATLRCTNPRAAVFSGWARTVRSEDSGKDIVLLDLEQGAPGEEEAGWIGRVAEGMIAGGAAGEREFAVRGGKVYIPRLVPMEGLNALVERGGRRREFVVCPAGGARGSLKLEVERAGDPAGGGLFFGEDEAAGRGVGEGEVRVRVERTFLRGVDLETVMGRNARREVGVDVVGRVVEGGEGVLGGRVVAMVKGGAVRGEVVVEGEFVVRVPEGGTPWSVAAVYTAYRATLDLSRKRTRRVVVFDAVGGYGLAAVAVFRNMGVEVIAVVSGEEQRELVKVWTGVEDGFVLCEGPGLAERVLDLTGDVGADLVFDPVPSKERTEASFACVATNGRIFQVVTGSANWDVARLPTRPFDFVRFDLDGYFASDRVVFDSAFQTVYSQVSSSTPVTPEMCRTFKFGQAGEALQLMERDSAGIYALEYDADEEVRLGFYPAETKVELSSDGAYIVIGGVGGLGLSCAEWLVEKGAGHVILVSRSGVPASDALSKRLQALRDSPTATIHTYTLDICDEPAVIDFAAWLQTQPFFLGGVIHAAGVLRDFTYQNMSHPDWTLAASPKTLGSWNLHTHLPLPPTSFFLFLSSAAGVIGNRGQSNYAAGNAFQDALAHHRPPHTTVSLDLGPVIGAGMVDQAMMDLLRSVGYFGIRRSDMFLALDRAVAGATPPQIVLGVGTGGLLAQNTPADPFWAETPLFAVLNRVDVDANPHHDHHASGGGGGGAENLVPRLQMAGTVDEAVEILLGPLIAAMVSIIPNIDASEILPHMTPNECRSDSMRGTNIDNWLKRTTGVAVGQAINGMPLRRICEEVVARGGFVGV
ncbi:ketoacyl-synt-domain-containing protein [Podospora conica]|nr:ketoacyl-synt-domain-containing protein [Schizothecium conicum]